MFKALVCIVGAKYDGKHANTNSSSQMLHISYLHFNMIFLKGDVFFYRRLEWNWKSFFCINKYKK